MKNCSFNVVRASTSSSVEAFATLNVRLDNRLGIHDFHLKVDIGAQENTLPFRTFRAMFPEKLQRT